MTDTGWRTATIERVERRTGRVVSVFLRAALPGQVAGQHLDVRLTAPDGYQARRSYSIASRPGAEPVELAIERLDDGEVSPYFHEVAQAGDEIEVRGPLGGHFAWRPADGGALLLVAGGSGVVPLVAMLRERAAEAREVPAMLVYTSRTWDDIVFRDELLAMAAADPLLRLVFVTTREPARREGDLSQRLDAAALRDLLAGWHEAPRHAYVCGGTAFVEAMAGGLVLAGLPPTLVRTERYGGA